MKRSLTKFLTSVATLTLLMASVASTVASANMLHTPRFEVRPYTMGGEGVNRIMKSQSNIWLFPQFINQYPNLAEGVFDDNSSGTNSFPRFGVHYQFNEGNNPFVVGVYVNNEATFNPYGAFAWTFGTNGPGAPFSSNPNGLKPNREYNVFYGRNLGGDPFGAQLQVFNSNMETEGVSRAGLTSVALNLGLTTGGGAWDWSAGIGLTTHTDEATTGTPAALTQLTEPDGNLYLKASGRRWFPVNSKITWVAHADVHYNKLGVLGTNSAGSPSAEEWTDFQFMGGLGLNYTPTSKVHAVLDVRIDYSALGHTLDTGSTATPVTDVDITDFSLPPSYLIGVDGEVFDWLDVRFGASSSRSASQTETNVGATPLPPKAKFNSSTNDTFFGLGFHFGDLEIDTYVSPRFVINGPDFVSGDDTRNMFMTAAATLHF